MGEEEGEEVGEEARGPMGLRGWWGEVDGDEVADEPPDCVGVTL